MPLDKNALGLAIHNRRKVFSDMDMNALVSMYGSLDNVRLAIASAEAEEIINHFKATGVIVVPGLGLAVGTNPVVGTAHGTIT